MAQELPETHPNDDERYVVLCSLPQLLYPVSAGGVTPTAAFLPASAATPAAGLTALAQPAAAPPHSPVTAQTLAAIGHPLIDYSTLAFAAGPQLHAGAAAFDAYQAVTAAPGAGFLAHAAQPASAAFTPIAYAAPAATAGSAAGGIQLGHNLAATAHYRPLSIQDRM